MPSLITIFCLVCSVVFAEESITLEQVLKSTLQQNGQIQEVAADIEIARAQLERANAALFPQASGLLIAAPIFKETGDALHSQSDWSTWGPFLSAGAQIVEPIYTFGMISSYRKAAENQIIAREGLTDVKRAEMIAQAKEFFYGYKMACDLDELVGDLVKFLDEAVNTAEENKGKKNSNIKSHDVYKLKSALEDLRQKKLYAEQAKLTAKRAVGWVSGAKFENIAKGSLTPENFQKKPIEEYLKIAQSKRPEFKALKAGQEARLALRDAKRAQSYPALFIGAYGQVNWTPVRTAQPSVFAYDPFNSLMGGAGLGVKFDLEFARHSAEAAEQNAEYIKLKATEAYAVPGIDLQVKKAYWELDQAVQGLEVAKRRKELGKKWFVSSAMGWSIGLTPPKDLMEALEGDGLARKNYVETVYALNMALTHLSQAVGEEVTDLKYR